MQEPPDKTALRKTLLAKRQHLTAEVRREWDAAITAHLLRWWEAARPQRLGIYWPLRGEPDLRAAYERISASGTVLALPLVLAKDQPLVFAAWKPGEPLARDSMGVAVPQHSDARIEPQALLIPCVGFNRTRHRLGYGGGYYDRTLAAASPATVGIAYGFCRCDFEGDVHDVALDRVITENGES